MSVLDPMLQVENLSVSYGKKSRKTFAVQDISFSVNKGQTLGMVGESGCGKTSVALSLMGLLDKNAAVEGMLTVDGSTFDLAKISNKQQRELRGTSIAMVFQDSLAALNPLKRVGEQIAEAMYVKGDLSKKNARKCALELLDAVEIPEAKQRFRQYPHELSGGTRQRVMIAMAVSNKPKILICDEPTTALDVTVQAQILEMLARLQKQYGMTMVLVTHDLGVVSAVTDNVNVMYASKLVESGNTSDVMSYPMHPYSQALLSAMPNISAERGQLHAIPGVPPVLNKQFDWCPYGPRCEFHTDECDEQMPVLKKMGVETAGRKCACVHPLEIAAEVKK